MRRGVTFGDQPQRAGLGAGRAGRMRTLGECGQERAHELGGPGPRRGDRGGTADREAPTGATAAYLPVPLRSPFTGPAPAAAGGVRGRRGRGDLAQRHVPDGAPAAGRTRRIRLRVGPVVDRAPGRPPGQPVLHPPHGRPGRHPARLRHHHAAGRADHDPDHAGLRPRRRVQPADHRAAGPAVLRDVPGGPAVAGHPRRDRRRGPVRPVIDDGLAGLVPPEHRARHAVPADDAGGRGPAAPRRRGAAWTEE